METLPIVMAALFQILGFAIFFDQPQDSCSPAPSLASWIFLAATLVWLWDTNIYPCRFEHMAHGWKIVVESVVTIFLVELALIIVWCGLERFFYSLLEEIFNVTDSQRCVPFALVSWLKRLVSGSSYCKPSWHFYMMSGVITTVVSSTTLWYVLEATDSMYYVKSMFSNFSFNIRLNWRMLRCYLALNMTGRRRTLQICQMAANKSRCARRQPTRRRCPKVEEYDEDYDSE